MWTLYLTETTVNSGQQQSNLQNKIIIFKYKYQRSQNYACVNVLSDRIPLLVDLHMITRFRAPGIRRPLSQRLFMKRLLLKFLLAGTMTPNILSGEQ